MEALLNAKAALLLALLGGPGYGVSLTRRVRQRTADRVRLGHGNVYGALETLVREGLARRWTVTPKGRRGARARRYYELTSRGIEAAAAHRKALAGLVVARVSAPSQETVRLMRTRLETCGELSAGVRALRDKMREATE